MGYVESDKFAREWARPARYAVEPGPYGSGSILWRAVGETAIGVKRGMRNGTSERAYAQGGPCVA